MPTIQILGIPQGGWREDFLKKEARRAELEKLAENIKSAIKNVIPYISKDKIYVFFTTDLLERRGEQIIAIVSGLCNQNHSDPKNAETLAHSISDELEVFAEKCLPSCIAIETILSRTETLSYADLQPEQSSTDQLDLGFDFYLLSDTDSL